MDIQPATRLAGSPYSGMWRSSPVGFIDISKEHITAIFRVEE
jgi:hypothetical protein